MKTINYEKNAANESVKVITRGKTVIRVLDRPVEDDSVQNTDDSEIQALLDKTPWVTTDLHSAMKVLLRKFSGG